MSNTAPERYFKSAGDTVNVMVSFANLLQLDTAGAASELLTGTPAIVEITTSALTITNKSINTAITRHKTQNLAIGTIAQCTIAGGTAGSTYAVKFTCTTDATNAQILVRTIEVKVVADS